MPKKGTPLLEMQIRKAKPLAKEYNLYDTDGLFLTVAPTGRKWWRLKYFDGGRERKAGLGTYPEVSLADARAQRDAARMTLRNGQDFVALRKMKKASKRSTVANTFEAVAREWLAVKNPSWVASQRVKERRRLELHAFRSIGHVPVSEIKAAELRPLLDRLVQCGKVDSAHRLCQQMSSVFRHAMRDDRCAADPAAALTEVLPRHTQRGYSAVTDPEQVTRLLRALDGFSGTFETRCALQLAPLFFVRPGELRNAEWSEIDVEKAEWRIPATKRKLLKRFKEDRKTPPHVVPLATQALAVLADLRPLTGHGKFLFPGARDPMRPMSNSTLNAALRTLGFDKEMMTAHGFRHMASTMLHELGWDPDTIERQLGHKGAGIRAVYNRAQYLDERRRMMQSWADYLDKLRHSAQT